MTSPNHGEERHQSTNDDGNTSDDSLLLADDQLDRAPLLAATSREVTMRDEDLTQRSLTQSTHCHVPDDKFDYSARNRLILVLLVCIVFMVIEIVGGILSNSTAVVTDAAHMAIDVASFLISLTAMYLATKRPTRRLSFGYIRAEVLGALLSVLMIWLVTGVLVYMAVERCINQSFEVKATEMIIVASCGVAFNIIMFFILHINVCGKSVPHHGHSHGGGGGHGHSHGHGHSRRSDDRSNPLVVNVNDNADDGHDAAPQKRDQTTSNINVRAAIIHVIGDFVQSVGVLCAALLIKFKPEYKLADPICTFIFSVLVLITTITIMRDIIFVLMEGVPSNVNYGAVLDDLLRLPGVRNAHSLHIWSLSLQRAALSVHIAIDRNQDSLTALSQAQEMLRRDHQIARMTIQVEPYDEQVMTSCENCLRPSH